LKLVPFKSLGAVSYSPSIVTMALSCIVCESDLLVENREIFIPYLYFVNVFDVDKTRMIGLQYGEKTMTVC